MHKFIVRMIKKTIFVAAIGYAAHKITKKSM